MLKTITRIALLLILSAALTACGFHLRGNIPLSDGIKNMYVVGPEGSFKDQLERILTRAGAELAVDRASADVILDVTKASIKRTVGTLDERGKANSYNLLFSVKYSLKDIEGKNIRKPRGLNESRRYNFDPAEIVQSESEEAELLDDMEEQVSLRIVRQLSTITDFQPST